MQSDPVYLVRVVQETTAGFFQDCSAVQVRASKRLHKLEHITIIFCVCGDGWGRENPPSPHQNRAKRPSRNDPRQKRLTTETVRNLCSCATSAFLCPGIGRYIGHWPMPSRRVAEVIAAYLIFNIAIRETLSSRGIAFDKVWVLSALKILQASGK